MPKIKILNAMSLKKKRQERNNTQQISTRLDSNQDNNTTNITNNVQPVLVVKSEKFDSDDDIPLTQVKRHLNTTDSCLSKRRKLQQPVYIKSEQCSSYSTSQYIKSEEIEASNSDGSNFIIYEINEVNSSNEHNTKACNFLKNQAAEITSAQCLPPPPHTEKLATVWTYSKSNRTQNPTIYNNSTTNSTIPKQIKPKLHNASEIPGTSSSKQKATSSRKVAPTKVHGTPIRKVLTSYSEETSKCTCRLNPMRNVDVLSNLALKDFFERMFEETRKLKIEGRQMVKTDLLKAVSQAEEDVEAGKFCEKCYTMLAQPKKKY